MHKLIGPVKFIEKDSLLVANWPLAGRRLATPAFEDHKFMKQLKSLQSPSTVLVVWQAQKYFVPLGWMARRHISARIVCKESFILTFRVLMGNLGNIFVVWLKNYWGLIFIYFLSTRHFYMVIDRYLLVPLTVIAPLHNLKQFDLELCGAIFLWETYSYDWPCGFTGSLRWRSFSDRRFGRCVCRGIARKSPAIRSRKCRVQAFCRSLGARKHSNLQIWVQFCGKILIYCARLNYFRSYN